MRPPADKYKKALPRPEDIALLIEVGDTAASNDERQKLPEYARDGICETWLFDLQKRVVEVYREPSAQGYRVGTRHGLGDRLRARFLPLEIDLSAHFSGELRQVLESERVIEGLAREASLDRERER